MRRIQPSRLMTALLYATLSVGTVAGAWLLGQWNYLLFHTAVELFVTTIAIAVSLVAWSTRKQATNGFLVVLGAGMGPLAAVIVLHILAYRGIGVLTPPLTAGDPNPATQLWILSRYLLAATLFAAPFFVGRRARMGIAAAIAGLPSIVLALSIVVWHTFPTAFIPGTGLTRFKVWSEYAVIGVLCVAGILIWQRRDRIDRLVVNMTLLAIAAFVASELFLTLYVDIYGLLNIMGHLAQPIGFTLVLVGIFRTAVSRPLVMVYAELGANDARLTRSNRVLNMLSECRRAIADAETEEALLAAVCRLAAEKGEYTLVWIGEAVDDQDRSVRIVHACGEASGYAADLNIAWSDTPLGQGPVGTAIRTGESTVSRDIAHDPRLAPWREKALAFGLRSTASLPIDAGARRFGAIALYADEINRFDQEETALVVQLVASIGNGIEALRLRAERERLLLDTEKQKVDLENVVAERTAELVKVVADLENASQVKDQFMRNMSHELRTPLNSIIGFSGVMLRGLTGPLNDEQTTQLKMVESSGRHLLDLVSEILDLARIEARVAKVECAEVDACLLVSAVVDTMSVLAEERGLSLCASTPGHPITITTDEAKLRQIMLNLVGNAVKFTDEGSVVVSIDDSDPLFLRLTVTDTGCGIAESETSKIMEQFHQVSRVGGVKPEGAGLGLAIGNRLAELLGGHIEVSSHLGAGSVFSAVVSRNLQTPQDDPGSTSS
ncbi:MAG: signal transduction histidine [Actinobacteria bacterium]|nr:MAG: signal transduction histidine [Actinomycetota bacterium]